MTTKSLTAILMAVLATGGLASTYAMDTKGDSKSNLESAPNDPSWLASVDPGAFQFFTSSHYDNMLAMLDVTKILPADKLATVLELSEIIDAAKPVLYQQYFEGYKAMRGPVDVTAEACKNENANEGATCTGSYSYSNDYYDYVFTFGDITQSVCYGGYIQTNIVYGNGNEFCTAMATEQVCINGGCTVPPLGARQAPMDQAAGITGVSAKAVCWTCISNDVEDKSWLRSTDPEAYEFFMTSFADKVAQMQVQYPLATANFDTVLELANTIDAAKPTLYAQYLAEFSKSGGPVDVTAEACKNENTNEGATCTGSYSYSDDTYYYYFMFGDITQSVCYGGVVQTNLVIGTTNTFCTAMATEQVCINGECTVPPLGARQAPMDQAAGITGVSAKAVCWTCISNDVEDKSWLHSTNPEAYESFIN